MRWLVVLPWLPYNIPKVIRFLLIRWDILFALASLVKWGGAVARGAGILSDKFLHPVTIPILPWSYAGHLPELFSEVAL